MRTLISAKRKINAKRPLDLKVAVIAKPSVSWLMKKLEKERDEAKRKAIGDAIAAINDVFFFFAPYEHNGPKTIILPWKTTGI